MKVGLKIRKGFTLVELLIVIVVIGILAAAMMLASGSATDSAKASKLLSELRNAKAATLLWFADHSGMTNAEIAAMWAAETIGGTIDGPIAREIQRYMDKNFNVATWGTLGIGRYPATGPVIDSYWVCINPNGVTVDTTDTTLFVIPRKLELMAPGMVAYSSQSERFPNLKIDGTPQKIDEGYNKGNGVARYYMRVR